MDKKEIRDILLGRVVRLDENLWAAAPADARIHFFGITDGAGDVRLFGVSHLTHCYQAAEMKTDMDLGEVKTALNSMGRPMRLVSAPEGTACLYAPGWIAPVLLTLERVENTFKLSAYTGRSLIAGKLRCHIALRMLEQRLPAGFIRTEEKKAGRNKEEKHRETPQKTKKKTESPKKKTKPAKKKAKSSKKKKK